MSKVSNKPVATIKTVSDTQGKAQFLIAGTLDFDTVPELMKQARRLFTSVQSAEIDLAGVDSCNSAGLAVVFELAREMQQQNKTIRFKSVPEQIHIFARAYSVDNELEQAGLLC